MTIHTDKVRRLRFAEETTFGTDLTGTIASFIATRFVSAQLTLTDPVLETGEMVTKMDGRPYAARSEQRRATLTMTSNLTGQMSLAGNGTTQTQSAQGKILRAHMGSQRLGQGDLVAAGSAVGTVELDAIARWEAGAGIAFLGSDGRLVCRHIDNVTGGDADVIPDIDAADVPADNAVAYAAASYHLGDSADTASDNKTLQCTWEGLGTYDRFLLLGGKPTSVALTFPKGQLATIAATFQFVKWIDGADAATDLTADVAPLTYVSEASNGTPLIVHDSTLHWTTISAGADATLAPSEFQLSLNTRWVPVPSHSGINGVTGWARDHVAGSASGSFVVPFEDMKWFDYRNAATAGSGVEAAGYLSYQCGSLSTAGAVLIHLKVQITDVQLTSQDGLAFQRVSFNVGIPITTDTTDYADSPIAIHMF